MKITFQISSSYKRINFLAEGTDDYTIVFTKPGASASTSVSVAHDGTSSANESIDLYNHSWSFVATNNDDNSVTTLSVPVEYTNATAGQTISVDIPASRFKWSDATEKFAMTGFNSPTISRVTTVEYPEASGISDFTIPSAYDSYTLSPLYIGAWNTTLVETLSYASTAYPSGDISVFFEEEVKNIKETSVNNDNGLCCMYTAIKKVNERYETAKPTNKVLADRYEEDLDRLAHLFSLAQAAVNCGKPEDVQAYVTKAKKIANTTDECSCGTTNGAMVLDILGNVGSFVNAAADASSTDVNVVSDGDTFITVNENPEGTFKIGQGDAAFNAYLLTVPAFTELTTLTTSNNTAQTSANNTLQAYISTSETDIGELESYVGSAGSGAVADTFDNSNSTDLTNIIDDLDAKITTVDTSVNSLKSISMSLDVSFPEASDDFASSTGYNWGSSGLDSSGFSKSGNFPASQASFNTVFVSPSSDYAIYNVFVSAAGLQSNTKFTSMCSLSFQGAAGGAAAWTTMNNSNITSRVINEGMVVENGNNMMWLQVAIYTKSSIGDFFFIPSSAWFVENYTQFIATEMSINININSNF
tara:strand:+ start:11498 stop:13258 length:1761 start_codon:yes stop_codon:yes gene_type:complete